MSAEDRAPECVEHVWRLAELVLSLTGTVELLRCVRCGAEVAQRPEGGR